MWPSAPGVCRPGANRCKVPMTAEWAYNLLGASQPHAGWKLEAISLSGITFRINIAFPIRITDKKGVLAAMGGSAGPLEPFDLCGPAPTLV